MQVEQTLVEDLFDGKDKFSIPSYQRNYEWDTADTEQFLDDIKNTMLALQKYKKNAQNDLYKKYTYFIGSIVTYSDGYSKNLLLIDGQQRTTTICLIFVALRDLLKDKIFISQDETLYDEIFERLVNKRDTTEERLKLKPINKDFDIYKSLVLKEDLKSHHKNSNVYKNYQTIKKYINNLRIIGESIDSFWEALRRLEFVWIRLEYGRDNPQKIFESLNATGKKLEDGDLIRNYVLMNVHPDNLDNYYKEYWLKIEENCQGQKLTDFLRYYLILETKKFINEKDVYKEFKSTHPEFNNNILNHITILSNVFRKIKNGDYDKELKSDYLYILDFVKFGTSLSVQMQIMSLYESHQLSKSQTNECLALLESYFIRRKICVFPTNALNKIMPVIVKNLDGKDGDDYVKAFKINLTDTKHKFPTDKNFDDALKVLDLYSTKTFGNFFLARIEKSSNRELGISLQNIIHNEKITKEHIFPQKPSIRWKQEISQDDFNCLEKEKLHSLGNLTLTAYNQDLSNKPWLDKKEIFLSSAYTTLNSMLKKYDIWNKETFLKRENILIEKALNIWQRPKDIPIEEIEDIKSDRTLYDIPTHTKPRILSWNNQEITVKSWADVFIKIIEDIYGNNPEKFIRLMKQGEFGRIISFNKEVQRKSHELDDNVYLELNQNSENMFKQLIKIISLFDEFSVDDVLIEVEADTTQEIDMVA